MLQNSRYLKKHGTRYLGVLATCITNLYMKKKALLIYQIIYIFSLTQTTINQKEIQLTWTLFAICFSFILFVMPMVLHVIFVDLELYEDSPYIGSPIYALYWLQYSLNFFIYAARSDQYRKAYLFFLNKVSMM